MDLPPISIIVNWILLGISFIFGLLILRNGSQYGYHYGESAIQEKIRSKILRYIVFLIFIGIIASLYNVFAAFLLQ